MELDVLLGVSLTPLQKMSVGVQGLNPKMSLNPKILLKHEMKSLPPQGAGYHDSKRLS